MSEANKAPGGGERVRLDEVLNYKPEEAISEVEMSLIQNTFRGNAALIKVLRKVLIPTISDPSLPIESVNDDPFLNRDWAAMPEQEVKAIVLARQDAIKFVIGGLIKLQIIANQPVETDKEREARLKKDSSR